MRSTAIAVLLTIAAAAPLHAGEAAPPRVTVTGVGEMNVAPDEVVITVGVDALDQDISQSRAAVAARVRQVLEQARQHGLTDKEIQIEHVSIQPESEYRRERDRHEFVGYRTRQTIALTLRDAAKYEDFLTALLKVPVDRLEAVEWRTSRQRELRPEARRLAVEAAREKARGLAEALGQEIGPAQTITEEPMYEERPWGLAIQSNMAEIAGAGETRAVPGQLRIRARVTVAFELLPGSAGPAR